MVGVSPGLVHATICVIRGSSLFVRAKLRLPQDPVPGAEFESAYFRIGAVLALECILCSFGYRGKEKTLEVVGPIPVDQVYEHSSAAGGEQGRVNTY